MAKLNFNFLIIILISFYVLFFYRNFPHIRNIVDYSKPVDVDVALHYFQESLEFASSNRSIFYSEQRQNFHEWINLAKIKQSSYTKRNLGDYDYPIYVKNRKLNYLGFNGDTNKLVPLDRLVPDERPSKCRYWHYDSKRMPTVSVIIPFHFEDPIVLARTIYSILLHTARNLLAEIILVVDNENDISNQTISYVIKKLHEKTWIKNMIILKIFSKQINNIPLFFGEKFENIIIHWNRDRSGWSRSIQNVVNKSTGDVLIFLKSHVEVGYNWLLPLLAPIVEDSNSISVPTFGRIDENDFSFSLESPILIYWNSGLNIQKIPLDQVKDYKSFMTKDEKRFTYSHQVDLISNSQFAISRIFLGKINLFDSDHVVGQYLDNIIWDYTMKVKKCGGRILRIPCSIIYVLAKQVIDPMGQIIDQTHIAHKFDYQPKCLLKQFAEEFFYEFNKDQIESFYVYHPLLRNFPCKSSTVKLSTSKCSMSFSSGYKSGQMFELVEINDSIPLIRINTFLRESPPLNVYYGALVNIEYSICLSPSPRDNRIQMIESYCHDKPIAQAFRLDQNHRLLYEDFCLVPDIATNVIYAEKCFTEIEIEFRSHKWEYRDQKLIVSDLFCLGYVPYEGFIFSQCSLNNYSQLWEWIHYY